MTKINGLTDDRTKQLKNVLGADSIKKDALQGFGLHNLELEGFIDIHIYYDVIRLIRESDDKIVEIKRDDFDTIVIF